jgi:transposase InsO family protein
VKSLPSFFSVYRDAKHLALLYRICIEQGVLTRSRIAPNTFRRLVNQYELLKPDDESASKVRQAFAKAHANEMWQADTLVGPYVQHEGSSVQSRLIAFIDDASRVCCHGQFFPAENVDTLIEALRAAFYKRGVPQSLYVDNGSIYTSKEIIQICARVGCLYTTPRFVTARPKEKSKDFLDPLASSSWRVPST